MDNSPMRMYKIHFTRPRFKSVSIYTMELDSNKTIEELKMSLSHRFDDTPADKQRWVLQNCGGKTLENYHTLSQSIGQANGDTVIEVSVSSLE